MVRLTFILHIFLQCQGLRVLPLQDVPVMNDVAKNQTLAGTRDVATNPTSRILLVVEHPHVHHLLLFTKGMLPHFFDIVYACPQDASHALWKHFPTIFCDGSQMMLTTSGKPSSQEFDKTFGPVAELVHNLNNDPSYVLNNLRRDVSEVEGMLAHHADFFTSMEFLKTIDPKKMWISGMAGEGEDFGCTNQVRKKGWYWNYNPNNLKNYRPTFSELNNQAFDDIRKLPEYANLQTLYCSHWADAFYWPRSSWSFFAPLTDPLYKRAVMNEISVPAAMTIVEERHAGMKQGISCWGGCCQQASGSDILHNQCGHKVDLRQQSTRLALAKKWQLDDNSTNAFSNVGMAQSLQCSDYLPYATCSKFFEEKLVQEQNLNMEATKMGKGYSMYFENTNDLKP